MPNFFLPIFKYLFLNVLIFLRFIHNKVEKNVILKKRNTYFFSQNSVFSRQISRQILDKFLDKFLDKSRQMLSTFRALRLINGDKFCTG